MADRKYAVPFNVADYLQTTEQVTEYLNAALEDGNEQVLLAAILDVIKCFGGVAEIARRTNLSREAIYRAFSESGNPRLSSLLLILHALDLDISIVQRRDRSAA